MDPPALIEAYDRHEHRLEQEPPHRPFREVAAEGLRLAMEELGLPYAPDDIAALTDAIPRMGPFPEVPGVLERLRDRYPLCIISNTDDDLIAGNVENIGVPIDRVVTAQQAGAYKPSERIFEYAHDALGAYPEEVLHICASPHLDLVACRAMRLRCVWINRRGGAHGIEGFAPDAELPDLSGVPSLVDA